jgi:hypothetical protein
VLIIVSSQAIKHNNQIPHNRLYPFAISRSISSYAGFRQLTNSQTSERTGSVGSGVTSTRYGQSCGVRVSDEAETVLTFLVARQEVQPPDCPPCEGRRPCSPTD